jgi:hypothetical protein
MLTLMQKEQPLGELCEIPLENTLENDNNCCFACNAEIVAEGPGFEPGGPYGPTVFKTAAFVHSATPP